MATKRKKVQTVTSENSVTTEAKVYAHDPVEVMIFKNNHYPVDTKVTVHKLLAEKLVAKGQAEYVNDEAQSTKDLDEDE